MVEARGHREESPARIIPQHNDIETDPVKHGRHSPRHEFVHGDILHPCEKRHVTLSVRSSVRSRVGLRLIQLTPDVDGKITDNENGGTF